MKFYHRWRLVIAYTIQNSSFTGKKHCLFCEGKGKKRFKYCHNHPSGDPTPSEQDIALTEQLYISGEIIDIEVLDHIIIGRSTHVSMKDQKLM